MHDRAEDRLATMADPSFWRRRAPIWLRVLLGLLILPVFWACFTLTLEASLPPIKSSLATGVLLVAGAVIAGFGSKVQVIPSQITGKQHLEKAGVLAVLDQTQ
jgi:hypothetical protein